MSTALESQRIRNSRANWKSSLTQQIIKLEDNLDELYQIAGLKPHRILQLDQPEDEAPHDQANPKPKTDGGHVQEYAQTIDNRLLLVKQAAYQICALINSVTEFDFPLPINVLLRLATRIASLRWTDSTKKMTGSLAKRYTYSKSPELISISMMMFKWISHPIGTNVIPFQTYINQNILDILEWTRSSGLHTQKPVQFLTLRSEIFSLISDSLEQLSLNLNLDSKQLKSLIHTELVATLHELTKKDEPISAPTNGLGLSTEPVTNELQLVKDRYLLDGLRCLERLFMVYGQYLEAASEYLLKNYVIQTCISIYRSFEENVIGPSIRAHLLRLLETLASQPHASSTTELGWHVFELAQTIESDPEIKHLARRALKIGLAHRPVLMSHHDVYDCSSRAMTSASVGDSCRGDDITTMSNQSANDNQDKGEDELIAALGEPETSGEPETEHQQKSLENEQNKAENDGGDDKVGESPNGLPPNERSEAKGKDSELDDDDTAKLDDEQRQREPECDQSKPEDDPEVQSCMSLFVSKPAH